MKKSNAFTLAEVLITLGIIGVVAAMTLPTLLTNVSNHIFATKIKQTYAMISSAVVTYMAANDLVNITPKNMKLFSDDAGEISVNNFFKESFASVISCYEPSPRCFAERYKINQKDVFPYSDRRFWTYNSSFLLRNGSAVSMIPLKGEDNRFRIVVDVNNTQLPNRIGRDLWVLYLNKDGSLSASGKKGACDSDYDTCLRNLQNNDWKPDF